MANLIVALAAVVLSGLLVGVPTGLDAAGVMGYRAAHDPVDAVVGLSQVPAHAEAAEPVPPLDGARILFSFVEACTGRRLHARWAARLNVLGAAALVALFALVTWIDAVRLLSGQLLVHQ